MSGYHRLANRKASTDLRTICGGSPIKAFTALANIDLSSDLQFATARSVKLNRNQVELNGTKWSIDQTVTVLNEHCSLKVLAS